VKVASVVVAAVAAASAAAVVAATVAAVAEATAAVVVVVAAVIAADAAAVRAAVAAIAALFYLRLVQAEEPFMTEYQISPRFNDTDCLGHINNATIATWFEEGRKDYFRFFNPSLAPKDWNLIVARIEIDYLAQTHYQHDVSIHSSVEKIGNSSFVIYQECHQEGKVVAKGKASLVHFDYKANKSLPIPDPIKEKLKAHLLSSS
jgi:acyl-CoA thioester hydrolase